MIICFVRGVRQFDYMLGEFTNKTIPKVYNGQDMIYAIVLNVSANLRRRVGV